MTIKSNVCELKSYISKAPEGNRSKIKHIIKLYEERKIVNIKTALNTTLLLASTNKNTIKSGKADKAYNNIVEKYGEAQPITGRLKREAEAVKSKIKKQSNNTRKFKRIFIGCNSIYQQYCFR